MGERAIVIGAGIAGLAVSIRLALKGYQVEVFEANPGPGGKLNAFALGEYRFDFGPSLFTMPQLVDEIFASAGKDPRDYFRYLTLEEACRYFYPDGMRLDAFTDASRFAAEVERKLGVTGDTLTRYLDHARFVYETAGEIFLTNSLHRVGTYLNFQTLKALAQVYRMGVLSSMHQVNQKKLRHPKLVQLFDRMATYNGSSPYLTPGILCSIASLEHVYGTYFPVGGMFQITLALFNLARELGVRFQFNTPVERIRLKHGRTVAGVVAGQGEEDARLVFSNMDVVPTYRTLLPGVKPPGNYLKRERSSSAVVFYWGIDQRFEELGLHNIFFSANYLKEFRAIFEKGAVGEDPTIYVNISSKHEPGDAPAGCENWFVMVNAPHNDGQPWGLLVQRIRQNVLDKLENALGREIEQHIVEERIVDPRVIEKETGSFQGALYGSSSNSMLSAFLRHPNFSGAVKGLYFCGGSVHPGGGIPLCLLSAKIAASFVKPAHP